MGGIEPPTTRLKASRSKPTELQRFLYATLTSFFHVYIPRHFKICIILKRKESSFGSCQSRRSANEAVRSARQRRSPTTRNEHNVRSTQISRAVLTGHSRLTTRAGFVSLTTKKCSGGTHNDRCRSLEKENRYGAQCVRSMILWTRTHTRRGVHPQSRAASTSLPSHTWRKCKIKI